MANTALKKEKEGYGYMYTDLAKIHEYLESKDWCYTQEIEVLDGVDYIVTTPIKEGKECKPIRGCRVVQATLNGKTNPAQEQGSALTYARRYSLLMAFGLCTSDDDAAACTQEKTPQKKESTRDDLIKQTKELLEVKGISIERYEEVAGCPMENLNVKGLNDGIKWIKGA